MARDFFSRTVAITDDNGNVSALSGIEVYVYEPGTTNTVTIYANPTGSVAISNPITTSSNGLVEFYADVGEYDVRFHDPSITPRISDRTVLWNAINAGDRSIPSRKIDEDGNLTIRTMSSSVYEHFVPTGGIIEWPTNTAPSGWLLCDGSAVSRSTYRNLFDVIGTTYGEGDRSTTFNLPDHCGRSPMGAGRGSGLTARNLGSKLGAETHTLTIDELTPHRHSISDPGHMHENTTGIGQNMSPSHIQAGTGYGEAVEGELYTRSATTGITIQSAGGGRPHANVHPVVVVNFIIKT